MLEQRLLFQRAKPVQIAFADGILGLDLDAGIGAVTGYSLGGRKDVFSAVQEALTPVASLGVKDFTFDIETGSDDLDFLLEGVPTLVANQAPANYMLNYHAASDTFDKVDIPELKRHVAIAAVTTYALAGHMAVATRRIRAPW